MQVPFPYRPAAPALSWYGLTWPKELEAKQVHAWLRALAGKDAGRGVRFFIVAEPGTIQHILVLPALHDELIRDKLAAFLPGIEVADCEPLSTSSTIASQLKMTSRHRVLDTNAADVVSHAILTSMQALRGSERIVFEIVLGDSKSPDIIPNDVTSFHSGSMAGATLEAMAGKSPTKLDTTARNSMRDKHGVVSWDIAAYIGITANTKRRRLQLLTHLVGGIKTADAPGVRLGSRATSTKKLKVSYEPILRWPLTLNADELTGLIAWPLGDRTIAGVQRIISRHIPVPKDMPRKGPVIAMSNVTGSTRQLILSPHDMLMHLHLLGPTGGGKSTLMINLAAQVIEQGYSVIMIDPKGDLIHDMLCRIPENRKADVVVLDPSDMTQPVGLNPLAHAGSNANLVADDLLNVFHKLYGSYFGPRTRDILHASLLTLMLKPGMSLCALPFLFTDPEYRAPFIALAKKRDPLGLGSFWTWYEGLSRGEQNNATAPLMNKVREFLMRPSIRLVMGQSSPKFTIDDVFTKRKILLVNLAKGSLGKEQAQLFGSLVITEITHAIQKRSSVAPERRYPVFWYTDEVQDYMNTPSSFEEVLAQARSNGVGLGLAHQNWGQLPKDLKSGIQANARSQIRFQLAHDDAYAEARGSAILTPEDFERLPKHSIFAKLVHDGQVSDWISGETLPPCDEVSDPQEVTALSQKQYGVPAKEVEAALMKLVKLEATQAESNTFEQVLDTPEDFGPIGHRKATMNEQLDWEIQRRNVENGLM